MNESSIIERIDHAVVAVKALGIGKYHLEIVGAKAVVNNLSGLCSHCGREGQKFYAWSVRSDSNGYGNEDGEICPACREEILAEGED